ncbi:MAG: glycoside hydrolase family 20 zincin-like fold domain-containing protein, partial [Bacteroidales bacterium]
NRILFLSCILLFFTLSAYATKEHLLPLPQKSNFDENVSFNIKRDIKLTVPETGENDPAIVEEITSLITSYGGNIVPTSRTKINVIIVPEVSGAEFQSESYSIDVNTSNITIRATTFRGAYWAVQT